MPSFDIVSEIDLQEVRNAVDQANREASTRFDFKNTNPVIEFTEKELKLACSTEDRLRALYQLLEEKLVKRQPLGLLSHVRQHRPEQPGKRPHPQLSGHFRQSAASQGAARQRVVLKAGISQEIGKKINKMVKEFGIKNLSSSIQGDQVRVTGKQRDDLQAAMAKFKEADMEVPLQFTNFRD